MRILFHARLVHSRRPIRRHCLGHRAASGLHKSTTGHLCVQWALKRAADVEGVTLFSRGALQRADMLAEYAAHWQAERIISV